MNGFARRSTGPQEVRDEPTEPTGIRCGWSGRGGGAGGGILSAARGKEEQRSFLAQRVFTNHSRQQDHNRGGALRDGTGRAHSVADDSGGGTGSGLETNRDRAGGSKHALR